MSNLFVVGLTGGIGSGKTTVAELFSKKGISIIDADLITRELTRPGELALTKIIEHFGKNILNQDGSLDRKKLRKIIFTSPAERHWLEELLHPLVRNEMKNQAQKAQSPYSIAVIPLLFETEKNPLIKRVLVVDAPEEIQIERAHLRDQLSKDEIETVLKSQISREKRLAGADDVIDNRGSLEDLAIQVNQLHGLYLNLLKPSS